MPGRRMRSTMALAVLALITSNCGGTARSAARFADDAVRVGTQLIQRGDDVAAGGYRQLPLPGRGTLRIPHSQIDTAPNVIRARGQSLFDRHLGDLDTYDAAIQYLKAACHGYELYDIGTSETEEEAAAAAVYAYGMAPTSAWRVQNLVADMTALAREGEVGKLAAVSTCEAANAVG